jgi:hypothetical protein
MTHLKNYSKIDLTNIMLTLQDVYAVAAKLLDCVNKHSLEDTSLGVKYRHELMFY